MMRAAIYQQYGGPEVLRLAERNTPTPKAHEILIRVHATAVNSADVRLRKADPFAIRFVFGLFKPKNEILGGVLSGEVVAVGAKVHKFKPGDAVFGSTLMAMGTYAEYVCVAETAPLALKPVSLTHEEAAVLPFGASTAIHFLQKAGVKAGQKVLIYGATGAVGSAAVQMAKHLGAEVTAVCSSAGLDLAKSLGADHVIDYTRTNFAETGEEYDVMYETVDKAEVSDCLKVLKPKGVLVLGAALLVRMLQGLWANLTSSRRVIAGVALETEEGIQQIANLAAQGVLKPVIDRSYTLEQIAEAHAYVDTGRKKGNVCIRIVGA